ncbi:hypothetical protein AVDCRST_MAG94-2646, partial [uncultured Leptolyngbya sp.]
MRLSSIDSNYHTTLERLLESLIDVMQRSM